MNQTIRKKALLLGMGLLIILLFSCVYLFVRYKDTSATYTAYIYQNGKTVDQIDLSTVTEEYLLTYYSADGGKNVVRVVPGGICVIEADCPDLVCVHQGTIRNSLLPITCLPHGLVIELHENNTDIDTVTY